MPFIFGNNSAMQNKYMNNNISFQGLTHCSQILSLGGFSALLNFLLGPTDSDKRRWSSVQAQDFGPLHSIISTIILSFDMTPHQTSGNNRRVEGIIYSFEPLFSS